MVTAEKRKKLERSFIEKNWTVFGNIDFLRESCIEMFFLRFFLHERE